VLKGYIEFHPEPYKKPYVPPVRDFEDEGQWYMGMSLIRQSNDIDTWNDCIRDAQIAGFSEGVRVKRKNYNIKDCGTIVMVGKSKAGDWTQVNGRFDVVWVRWDNSQLPVNHCAESLQIVTP
jgi:hypothetical protein